MSLPHENLGPGPGPLEEFLARYKSEDYATRRTNYYAPTLATKQQKGNENKVYSQKPHAIRVRKYRSVQKQKRRKEQQYLYLEQERISRKKKQKADVLDKDRENIYATERYIKYKKFCQTLRNQQDVGCIDVGIITAIADIGVRDDKEDPYEDVSTFMRPLTDKEQTIVDGAVHGIGPPAEILARHDTDSVQRGSMETLKPGEWLNDEIINYFLKNYLAKRDEMLCAKQLGRKRSHFFNSFFIQTMFDEKNNNPKLRGKYNYKNVKHWGRKVPGKNIFDLKYIFIPINLDNLHWTSAVIFMEEKKIQYFDSMGATHMIKLRALLQYLKDEYKAKKGGELNPKEWTLVGCSNSTPRQGNGFDCGVFTCLFGYFVVLKRGSGNFTFDPKLSNHMREWIAHVILNTGELATA